MQKSGTPAEVREAAAEGERRPHPWEPHGQAGRLLRPHRHHARPEPAHRPGRRAPDRCSKPHVPGDRHPLQHWEVVRAGVPRTQPTPGRQVHHPQQRRPHRSALPPQNERPPPGMWLPRGATREWRRYHHLQPAAHPPQDVHDGSSCENSALVHFSDESQVGFDTTHRFLPSLSNDPPHLHYLGQYVKSWVFEKIHFKGKCWDAFFLGKKISEVEREVESSVKHMWKWTIATHRCSSFIRRYCFKVKMKVDCHTFTIHESGGGIVGSGGGIVGLGGGIVGSWSIIVGSGGVHCCFRGFDY